MGKYFEDEKSVMRRRSGPAAEFPSVRPSPAYPNSTVSLIREYHMHQVAELAKQNKVLREQAAASEELCNHYSSLFEIAPVSVFVLTVDGQIAEINRHAAALLGEQRDKLTGQHFSSYVAAEGADCWRQLCDRLAKRGVRHNTVLQLRRADGTVFSANLDGIRMTRGAQEMIYIVLGTSDIPLAQDNMSRPETAKTDTPVFNVFVLPPDGAMYVEYLSANAEDLFEIPVAEMLQNINLCEDRIHPEDRAAYQEEIRRSRELLLPFSFEYRIVVPSGNLKFLHAIARPFARKNGDIALFGVLLDVTARKYSDALLEKTSAELQAMATQLQLVRQEERSRIARDLHDELGQELTALKIDIEWIKSHLGPDQDPLKQMADELVRRVDGAVASVRRVSKEMRPKMLEVLDLQKAIEWLVMDFEAHAAIPCNLVMPDQPLVLSEEQAIHLYYICQELLTNIVRHANAAGAVVIMKQENGNIFLAVADDGRGIQPDAAGKTTLGLLGVRERVQKLGGLTQITSAPEIQGTRVIIRIPQLFSTVK